MYKLFLSAFIFIFCPLNAFAALCVENNVLKCDDLGYTESACPYGGIACPFDISRWYCATWTCDDGRYFSEQQDGMECVEVTYKDLDCFDCSEAQKCTAYDEKSLNEALDCADCPVITVLNDISITDKLPDLKEGRTLKAADGQTYTITVNPSGDIQPSDPEITVGGQTGQLSQLFGAAPGIILTTAAGSRIDNIHFDVAATHNVDAVIVSLGDTTFNNLSIVIDGKDEESERMFSAGVFPLNPGGKFAFEGDTYIEMKNIKGRQAVAGVFDFISMASPETAASITADNIDIRQENISGEDGRLIGLVLENLDVSGGITVTQNGNDDAMGLYINSNATINGGIEITQNGNDDAMGLYINNNATINGDIEITQSDSSSATGIDTDGALKARNITITQKNIQNNASDAYDSARYLLGINGTGSSNGDLIGSIEADTIRITQDTFGTKAPVINPAVVVDPSGIYIDKIKAKQITIYQDAKPQAPYRAANEAYGIRTNTSEIENAHITQLPLITGGTFYALYGGQYNNVTIVSEDNVVLGRYGDISITGTADITLINGAYLSTGTYSNIFINNAVVNRQCSELYPSSKPDNITINNLTDNYTPCE